jgi:hypothetical protein
VRCLAVPDLTTTVLTRTVTGLAADSSLAGGSNPRFAYRAASVFLLLFGASFGAVLVRFGPAVPLLISALFVLFSITALSSDRDDRV